MMTTNFADQIERYLDGQMAEEERESFKQVLRGVADMVRMKREEKADLEAQLLAATSDGWTYVDDEMPPPEGVKLLLTRVFGRRLYIEEGRYESKYIEHGGFTDMSGIILSDNVIAYMLYPAPAPLRTAANVEEPTP